VTTGEWKEVESVILSLGVANLLTQCVWVFGGERGGMVSIGDRSTEGERLLSVGGH